MTLFIMSAFVSVVGTRDYLPILAMDESLCDYDENHPDDLRTCFTASKEWNYSGQFHVPSEVEGWLNLTLTGKLNSRYSF